MFINITVKTPNLTRISMTGKTHTHMPISASIFFASGKNAENVCWYFLGATHWTITCTPSVVLQIYCHTNKD